MKRILFQGYSEALNKWVQGFYFMDDCESHWIIRSDGFKYFIKDCSSIGEYTGKKDNDGNLIFEGHIVLCSDGNKRIVWYSEDESSFKASCINPKNYIEPFYLNEDDFEIVGHIYNTCK